MVAARATGAAGFRQVAEGEIEQRPEFRRGDVAGDTDRQVVLGEALGQETPKIVDLERGDALDRAPNRPAIGMTGKRGLEPGETGDIVGILCPPPQARLDLIADSLDRFGIEPRLDQRQPQELEGALPVLGQGLELAGEAVPAGV